MLKAQIVVIDSLNNESDLMFYSKHSLMNLQQMCFETKIRFLVSKCIGIILRIVFKIIIRNKFLHNICFNRRLILKKQLNN